MAKLVTEIRTMLNDPQLFIEKGSALTLRNYQRSAADAIINSVRCRLGLTIVVMFPRQSGKNEIQAQIETYLLTIFSELNGEIIKVSPTWKPQSLNAMRRLERVLKKNILVRTLWKKESGYIYRIGSARIYFLSGGPEANIVGATASTLLEVDEAQDVQIAKFDKDISPMAASTNATRVFWGTAWTSRTLLARELRAARDAECRDGIRRVFVVTADDVAAEVNAYKKFVDEQVAKLGRNHPLVKTQFFSEEIDAEGGMFPAARRAMMQGSHEKREDPEEGKVYCALLDLAGEDEGATDEIEELQNEKRDLTALTIVECDMATVEDPLIQAPTYRMVNRYQWIGTKHSELYGKLRGLLEHWHTRWAVVDATGVGAGLASFLAKSMGERVIPFVFTSASKSRLGWDYLAICDTGRWQEAREIDKDFQTQLEYCEYVVLDGPGKLMRWGVPDGTRSTETGELLHDDKLISAALSAILDQQEWFISRPAEIIQAADVLDDLDDGF